jgi:hypothetical protein
VFTSGLWRFAHNEPSDCIIVVRQPVGWEVREEHGPVLLRSATVTDWHRVERTMQTFKLQPFKSGK